jgi:hypothetical protein
MIKPSDSMQLIDI